MVGHQGLEQIHDGSCRGICLHAGVCPEILWLSKKFAMRFHCGVSLHIVCHYRVKPGLYIAGLSCMNQILDGVEAACGCGVGLFGQNRWIYNLGEYKCLKRHVV